MQNSFRTMFGMIFKPQNKSLRHFLSFRNKLTLLPLKTYLTLLLPKDSEGAAMAPFSGASIRIDPRRVIKGELGDEVNRLNAPPPN